MKKLLAILLVLILIAAGAAALASPGEAAAALTLGFAAPARPEGARESLCAAAFAYAAERAGARAVILRWEARTESGEGDASPDPASVALDSLLREGVDGVAVLPESAGQAIALAERASEAGAPIVIVGLDASAALPDADAGEPPYVACVYSGEAAALTAAKWLEEHAESPLLFHCALPGGDPAIQAGLRQALNEAVYLDLADEIEAEADSVEAGQEATQWMLNSQTMFFCALADSTALAEGCARALRANGAQMPLAVISDSEDALALLDSGAAEMVACAPASVEGVRGFRLLCDFLTDGALPEAEDRLVALPAVAITAGDREGWIAGDDFETAYALVYPEADAE